MVCFCFFKQKTAYELRISDWSTDVCSSDLAVVVGSQCADQPSCRVTRLSASLVESKLPGSLPRASGGCRQPTKPMPKEKAAQKSAAICISMDHWTTHWCRRRESNSHEGLPRRILNTLRLPSRHLGESGDYNDRHGFHQYWEAHKKTPPRPGQTSRK